MCLRRRWRLRPPLQRHQILSTPLQPLQPPQTRLQGCPVRLTCSVRFPVGDACDEKQLWLMGSGQVMHCAAMILARLLQLVSCRRSQPVVSGDTNTHSNGRGRGFQTSVAAGRYYVQAPKTTQVFMTATLPVWEQRGMKAEWVTQYWSQGKMRDE